VPKQLFTEIDIDAAPARVWEVLTDFEAYPRWNPFITGAEGVVEVGQRVTLRMQPVGARGVTLRPTITQATVGSRLRWQGRIGIGGLFDAEHTFDLEARKGGGTRLCQSERFAGLLVPFMARSLDEHTLPAFVAMNTALRNRAEQQPAMPGA
jgi:hypothetical protein